MQFELDALNVKSLFQYTFATVSSTGIVAGYFIDMGGLTHPITLTLNSSAQSLTSLYQQYTSTTNSIPSNYISLVINVTGSINLGTNALYSGLIPTTPAWPTLVPLTVNTGAYRLLGKFTLADRMFQIANTYTQLQTEIDYNGGTSPVYVGDALPGTAASAIGWRIKLLTYDGNGNLVSSLWANGSSTFMNAWTNRASLTYSVGS